MEKKKKELFTVQDIAIIPLFAALITLCSLLEFHLEPYLSLQTFGCLLQRITGYKRGVTTIIVYILMGMIGLPVFGGAGGIGVLAGNTGGYIIGFVLSAVIIGIITSRIKGEKPAVRFVISVVSMVVGDMACMAVGTVQFMMLTDIELSVALAYCVVPFIIPDLIKIVVAAGFVERIKKIINLTNI